jgi:raffinose/stachyose/melibiose transport system permease protein
VREAFLHSVVLILFFCVLPVLLGLLLASALSRNPVRGLSAFRSVLFLPQILASVVVAVAWRWIYAPDGPLNAALRSVGLGVVARPWLGDFTFALPSIGVIGTWVSYGLAMALFVAGVQRIPSSLYEAARVDGAGAVREFFAVTLPGLRNELVVAVVVTVIAALRSFDLIFVTTQGGPGTETTVPALLVYNRAFTYGQVGAACATGVALALVILLVVVAITRLGEERGR